MLLQIWVIMLKLFLNEVPEDYARENFRRISESINNDLISSANWRFIELLVEGVTTNFKFKHNLKFIPKDVIITSMIGGVATFNYSLFDETNIDLNTTATTTVRFLLGRFDAN